MRERRNPVQPFFVDLQKESSSNRTRRPSSYAGSRWALMITVLVDGFSPVLRGILGHLETLYKLEERIHDLFG